MSVADLSGIRQASGSGARPPHTVFCFLQLCVVARRYHLVLQQIPSSPFFHFSAEIQEVALGLGLGSGLGLGLGL